MKKIITLLTLALASCTEQVESYEVSEVLVPTYDTTEMVVINESEDSVLIYLTLSGYTDSLVPFYVQNVKGIFGIEDSGLVGSFYLGAGDTISYLSPKRFSGNLCFGTQPMNCYTKQWPTGTSFFEFNINVPQESIDISCVGGVNSIIGVDLVGGPEWVAASFMDVRKIQNDSMYKNTNLVGVYPYGCTNCVNDEGKQPCQTPSEKADSSHICNPTRAEGVSGGMVMVKFKGYTNIVICNK